MLGKGYFKATSTQSLMFHGENPAYSIWTLFWTLKLLFLILTSFIYVFFIFKLFEKINLTSGRFFYYELFSSFLIDF